MSLVRCQAGLIILDKVKFLNGRILLYERNEDSSPLVCDCFTKACREAK